MTSSLASCVIALGADRHPRTISGQRHRQTKTFARRFAIDIGTYLHPSGTIPIKHPDMTSVFASPTIEVSTDRDTRAISRQ